MHEPRCFVLFKLIYIAITDLTNVYFVCDVDVCMFVRSCAHSCVTGHGSDTAEVTAHGMYMRAQAYTRSSQHQHARLDDMQTLSTRRTGTHGGARRTTNELVTDTHIHHAGGGTTATRGRYHRHTEQMIVRVFREHK